jgi:heme/copper-type cytochrome/quinol oxidase subunit 2
MSTTRKKHDKRTYFGIASLLTAILSLIFLGLHYGVSQLRITPQDFFFWNVVTTFGYCITVPIAFILAYFAWRKIKDARPLAITAVIIISVPFLILFVIFVRSFFP